MTDESTMTVGAEAAETSGAEAAGARGAKASEAEASEAEAGGLSWVGQVTPADTRSIEAGLQELWRTAEAGEVGGPLVRAASMTLIVPVQDEAAADSLAPILEDLAGTHPSRVVLIILDEDESEPHARLSSHSGRPGDGESVRYWEEIRLVAPRRAIHQIMSAVSTLVLPSLPVQCWWPVEPSFDDDLYNHVAEIGDRIVLDSSGFAEPTRAIPLLSAGIEATHETVAFGDLSWTRLTPWRLLAAEFFDTPADQGLLDSVQKVRVEFATSLGGESAQALLFVGWLASRLGWEERRHQAAGGGGWRIELVDGVRPVQVEIVRAPTGRRDGQQLTEPGIRSITIEAVEQDRRVTYSIERVRDDEAKATRADGDRRERFERMPSQDELDILRDELGGFSTDRIYQESLAVVAKLFGAGSP